MSIADILQAFASAAEAKQRYELACAQLRSSVRQGGVSGIDKRVREVIELGVRAAELEAAAEALLRWRPPIH